MKYTYEICSYYVCNYDNIHCKPNIYNTIYIYTYTVCYTIPLYILYSYTI